MKLIVEKDCWQSTWLAQILKFFQKFSTKMAFFLFSIKVKKIRFWFRIYSYALREETSRVFHYIITFPTLNSCVLIYNCFAGVFYLGIH